MPPDLVGLALSGGGIRAASVGLGVMQSLQQRGLFEKIDYLSTVSGGSYVGAYVSSAAISTDYSIEDALGRKASDAPRYDTREEGFSGQPPLVKRLIYGGKYLFRPWEAANKYLIGLFFNNILLFSGLIAAAAAIALLWRWLDREPFRNLLKLLQIDSGVLTAFLPFLLLFFLWTCAWLFSYIKYEAEAPGRIAQVLQYFTVGSFLVGAVVLIVNPETTLGFLSIFSSEAKVSSSGLLAKFLLGAVAAGLTPFINPGKLMSYGLQPQSFFQRAIFQIAMFALFVGVPLVVVGVLCMPNISNTADNYGNDLRSTDIADWPALLGVIDAASDRFAGKGALSAAEMDLASRIPPNPAQSLPPFGPAELAHFRPSESLIEDCRNVALQQDEFDPYQKTTWQRAKQLLEWGLGNDNDLSQCWRAEIALDAKKERYCRSLSKGWLTSPLLPFALVPPTTTTGTNLASAETGLERIQSDASQIFERLVRAWRGGSNADTDDSVAKAARSDSAAPGNTAASNANDDKSPNENLGDYRTLDDGFGRIHEILRQNEKNALAADGRDEFIEEARWSYRNGIWSPDESKGFNLALLRALHPECFYTDGKAYRWVVIDADQTRRKWILGIALVVFVASAGLINLNTGSLHRFYRNRIRQAFFVPRTSDDRDGRLSELKTTERGAPYHLINATIDLDRPRFLDEADAECAQLDIDRRDHQIFTFARLYCGCDATGWIRSEKYEAYRKDNINVADAVALSGSLTDPMWSNNLGAAWSMFALNLSLGQWMPNPRYEKPKQSPNALALVRDWFVEPAAAQYCYVSDGGLTENLGILSLLRRRCRLIIAVDSGHDPEGSFSDLNNVMRQARIRFGIKFHPPKAGEERQPRHSGSFPQHAGDPNLPPEEFDTSCFAVQENGYCRRHFLLARIEYPGEGNLPQKDGSEDDAPAAWLVYIKPSFTGNEGADLTKYRLENTEFPFDNTLNQFYDNASSLSRIANSDIT